MKFAEAVKEGKLSSDVKNDAGYPSPSSSVNSRLFLNIGI